MEQKIHMISIFPSPVYITKRDVDLNLIEKTEIEDVIKEIHNYNYCGIIAACVSPETAKIVLPEFKKQNLPYGFKVNAFKNIPDDYLIDEQSGQQPTSILGTRKDLTPGVFKKLVDDFVKQGANLLGGCCEIKPRHIQSIKNLI